MTTAVLDSRIEIDFDLKVADRCDRCGAQAFIAGLLDTDESRLEVLLCVHHANSRQPSGKTHVEALESQGFRVLDFSYRLNEKPSPSSSELD